MPCDYKNYPENWKTEIRPAILKRANDRCEFCKVKNHRYVLRGTINGEHFYQYDNGIICRSDNGDYYDSAAMGWLFDEKSTGKLVKIVLTIAHLDHDVKNNDFTNLKALCQRCHNRHDVKQRIINRSKTKLMRDGQLELFKE